MPHARREEAKGTGMKRGQLSALHHLNYGQRVVPERDGLENAWKAVKALAAGRGVLSAPQRSRLLGRMAAIATPPDVIDAVMAWNEQSQRPATLLARVGVPAGTRWGSAPWLIYEGLSVAMADGELPSADMEALSAVARRMNVSSETVEALAQLCRDEADLRRQRISMLSKSGIHVDQL